MPALVTIETDPEGPKISLQAVKREAEFLLNLCDISDRELSLFLTSDRHMAELNRTWRNRSGPTNVLSFPMANENGEIDGSLLGDIIISIDTAGREAIQEGISLHRRFTTLLIHGLLHLLGYDHERSDREATRMENKEHELTNKLTKYKRRERMVQLAVNVDHVATLRQARGINEPDPVQAAGICELAGAAGIVVHLREDRRHIQDRDVILLRQTVKSKLNLEMGATEEIVSIALDLKPDMVTLVPEKRKELTTEGGLNVAGQRKKLAAVVDKMTRAGIPVSMFIDPNSRQIKASKEIGATFVEIHTGKYCDADNDAEQNLEFDLIADAAAEAYEAGLRVNAGHGLNYLTTARVAALGTIEELSIGHAIMARAILVGLDQAVREMLALLPK